MHASERAHRWDWEATWKVGKRFVPTQSPPLDLGDYINSQIYAMFVNSLIV